MYSFHCWGVRPPATAHIRLMADWTDRFQSRVVPSALPLARVCPSGLKATESTAPPPGLPLRMGPVGLGCAGNPAPGHP